MYGVVLWSDPHVRKAVIWCEDQGYLAYYDAAKLTGSAEYCVFETGDYIEFDVEMDADLCRAHNAQMILSSTGQALPHTLDNVDVAARVPMRAALGALGARVIQLSDRIPRAGADTVSVSPRG